MNCPRCQSNLYELPDKSFSCWKCELHRKPIDKIFIRTATKHYILKRNINRVPPGSEVEVVSTNTISDDSLVLVLKSKTGLIISGSTDIEDLAILIVENEWYAHGPEPLLVAIDMLTK